MVLGTSEWLSQKAPVIAKWTYKLWEACATSPLCPSFCLWPVSLHLSELPREPPSSPGHEDVGVARSVICRGCDGAALTGPPAPAGEAASSPHPETGGQWQSWLILGTPTPHPCPWLQSPLPAVNSGTRRSHLAVS